MINFYFFVLIFVFLFIVCKVKNKNGIGVVKAKFNDFFVIDDKIAAVKRSVASLHYDHSKGICVNLTIIGEDNNGKLEWFEEEKQEQKLCAIQDLCLYRRPTMTAKDGYIFIIPKEGRADSAPMPRIPQADGPWDSSDDDDNQTSNNFIDSGFGFCVYPWDSEKSEHRSVNVIDSNERSGRSDRSDRSGASASVASSDRSDRSERSGRSDASASVASSERSERSDRSVAASERSDRSDRNDQGSEASSEGSIAVNSSDRSERTDNEDAMSVDEVDVVMEQNVEDVTMPEVDGFVTNVSE